MQTVLLIAGGLALAATLRYLILRRPISRGAALGTCFGILCGVGILVSTIVEKRFRRENEPDTLGPIPILAELVKQMALVGVPVVIVSYFILRRSGNEDGAG